MPKSEYTLRYKYGSAICNILVGFVEDGEIDYISLRGIPVDRRFPVLFEKVKEFVNSGFDRRQVVAMLNRIPRLEKDVVDFLVKMVKDLFVARQEFLNG